MNLASLRVAVVLAFRRAGHQRFRALAIVVALALPVAAATAADVVIRSSHLSQSEKALRQLGGSVAVVSWNGMGPLIQDPDGDSSVPLGAADQPLPAGPGKPPPASPPRSLLPAGSTLVAEADAYPFLASASHGDYFSIQGTDLNAVGPAGLVTLRSGRVPAAPGELALTPSAAAELKVKPGDTLSVPGSPIRLRLVGIVAQRYDPHDQAGFTVASTAEALQRTSLSDGPSGVSQWYVSTSRPIDWSTVTAFNRQGWTVISRHVVQDPPPASQVAYYQQQRQAAQAGQAPVTPADHNTTAVGSALLAVMLILEVIFIAGPAFAVGARRRQHELAVIGATGARPSQLVAVVAADGLVLGAVAAVLGAAVGIGAGAIVLAGLRTWGGRVPEAVSVRGWEIAGIAVLAVVSGLVAALIPALSASRAPLSEVLRGRQPPNRLSLRPAAAGVAALGVAIALAVTDLDETSNGGIPVPLVAAAVLAVVGVVLVTPAVLVAVGRLAGRLPLWARLAARDSARNRSAATPAVAAIIAVVAACTAGLIYGSSIVAHDRLTYLPSMPTGDGIAFLSSQPGVPVDATDAVNAVRAQLAPASVVELDGPTQNRQALALPPPTPGCPAPQIQFQSGEGTTGSGGFGLIGGGLPLCPDLGNPLNSSGPEYLVDNGDSIGALLAGPAGRAAAAALAAGKAVVFDPTLVKNGHVNVALGPGQPSSADLPAVAVTWPGPLITSPAQLVLPPSVASTLKLSSQPYAIYVRQASSQPAHKIQSANAALARLGLNSIDIQAPYTNGISAVLLAIVGADLFLALAVAVAATALLLADRAGDLRTLAAIGAAPRGRRKMAINRAGLICALGTILGVLAGLGPGIGLIWRLHDQEAGGAGPFDPIASTYPLSIPWTHIAAVIIVPPLIAALTATLLKGPKLETEARRPT